MTAARVLFQDSAPRSSLCRVVDVERELKVALGPLATKGRRRSIEVGCEIVLGVGKSVLGDSQDLRRIVTVTSRAVQAFNGTSGEVWVRVARRFSGFEPSRDVLVSVTASDGQRSQPFDLVWTRIEKIEVAPMPLSVLVVTPSRRAGRLLEQAAEQCGVLAVVATDASSALAKFAGHDVVLIDDMVEGRGTALIAAISSLGAKVMLATASKDPFERAAFTAAGVDTIVDKPVMPSDIAALGIEPAVASSRRGGQPTLIPR